MLRDHGRLTLREVLEPAIYYARHGHPLLPRVADTIADLSEFFREEWPTSFETWVPNGSAPVADQLFRNPALAETWGGPGEAARSPPPGAWHRSRPRAACSAKVLLPKRSTHGCGTPA